MTHGSLFSGIGGFDLAAEWMGWENIFHCEIGEFPRKILKYHFPKSICYEDIKKTDFTKHRGEIDIISGGFPCQPYSNAGKRRGKEDDRHLWPEMCRVIREIQPRFVVGENVAGLLSWNNSLVFHEIITDLENEGYETTSFLIPACATNAPHRRDRIWFVAYSVNCGYSTKRGKETEKDGIQSKIGKTMDTRQFDGTSVSRITANSNNSRTNERMQFDGERKENDEQWRGQSQSEYRENGSNGIIAHSSSNGRKDHGEKVNGREINKFKNRNKIWDKIKSNGKQSNVADTESQRAWEQSSEDRGWEDRRFDNDGETGNVADTNSQRHEERNTSTESIREARYNSEENFTNYSNWQNFPTQSPICGGDDGIPTELDGITFPKWRNESIKGYGNAVVPQVVYQIFKAIEQSLL